ncbi:hypothetical protein RUM43_013516 [Polyplax serrata]|uniref:Uncharacterized protein n=1 Tax=Polyplax serrata TaxID=468196 RepID=A0AAN8S737_POLSC
MVLQTTCISDLPDIAPAIATTGQTEGFYRGQNGSIRCNGRALRSRTSQIHQDSSSCSSKEDSLDDPKVRVYFAQIREGGVVHTSIKS